jgi:hypothetical protein
MRRFEFIYGIISYLHSISFFLCHIHQSLIGGTLRLVMNKRGDIKVFSCTY